METEQPKDYLDTDNCILAQPQPVESKELFTESDDPVWKALKEKYQPKKRRKSFIWDLA